MTPRHRENLVTKIVTMKRPGLVRLLRSLDCGFAMDFSDEFLESLSLERLRHIVLAACLHDHANPGHILDEVVESDD